MPLAITARAAVRMPWRLLLAAAGTGALGTTAITFYTLATRQQLLALAVVLAALYPVIPVVLGLTVLHERISRGQVLGLLLAGAAIGLIALTGPDNRGAGRPGGRGQVRSG